MSIPGIPDQFVNTLSKDLQKTIEIAQRDPVMRKVNIMHFHLKRHSVNVNKVRDLIDAKIVRRRAKFEREGKSIDRADFLTENMRDELEYIYTLESHLSAAVDEFKRLKQLAEANGN